MIRTLTNIRTLLRYASVLAAHDALLPPEYAARVPAAWRFAARVLGQRARAPQAEPGVRLAQALERLGPSAIKIGQLLATRPDLLGPEIARGLESLQDRLPPFPDAQARAIVESELARPLSAVFTEFGPPVAAASIAQVHKASVTGEGGTRAVAVKVLRPGIEAEFARDFDAFRFAAGIGESLSAESRRLRLRALVETLATSVAMELDLRMEGAAASELARNMASEPGFRVPSLDWSRTSQRVLTTEWIDGTPLRDPQTVRAGGHDPKRVAIVVLQTFLVQALRDGFFHADLHPGNLFLDASGRVCAVDFGIMGRLDPQLRRFMAETLGGFLARDYVRVANVHFEMGFVPRHHNVENFAQALRAIGEPVFGLCARDVSMARLLEQLFETTRRFDMKLQPQLVLMQKTMMVVEGVSRTLDPEFDIWAASQPVVQAWILDHVGPEARLREAAEGLSALGRLAQNAPRLIRDTESIATMMVDGGVKLHPESVSAIARAQTRRTRHVRVAIWIAALALVLIAIATL